MSRNFAAEIRATVARLRELRRGREQTSDEKEQLDDVIQELEHLATELDKQPPPDPILARARVAATVARIAWRLLIFTDCGGGGFG